MDPVDFAVAQGRIRLTEPAPGVFLSEIHGRATAGIVGAIVRFAEQMLAEGRRLLVFHDWEHVTGYEPEARRALSEWTERITPHWDGSHILFSSRLLSMAVAVAGLTMRGKLHTYSSREDWDRALVRACMARRTLSP